MMIALCVIAYLGVALLCVYLEARWSGDSALAPMWLAWPVMVPITLIAVLFDSVARLGEGHSR